MDRNKLIERRNDVIITVNYMMNYDGSWSRCLNSWLDLEKMIYHDEDINNITHITDIQELDLYDENLPRIYNYFLIKLKEIYIGDIDYTQIIVKEIIKD